MKGYKMVKEDYTAFYDGKTKYEIGKTLEIKNPDGTEVGVCGHGLHVSKEPWIPLKYNAKFPWRLLKVSYNKKDIIAEDKYKLRVKKLKVLREIEPWKLGLPNSKRVYNKIKSANKIKLKAQTKAKKEKIEILIKQHISRLNRICGEGEIKLKGIKFYTIKQWDSVRDSVWDSVRDSVWDSVRDSVRYSVWDSVRYSVWDSVRYSVWDSVWDSVRDSVRYSVRYSVRDSVWDSVLTSMIKKDVLNPFLPLQKICETGAIFYGIDKEGIAHVIMPDKSEIK